MLPIFTDSHKAHGAITLHPTINRFRELVKINVTRLQDYYSSNVRKVYDDHPFVQLLKHLPIHTEDPIGLFNTAAARYPYLSRNLKFTSDYNRGSFQGHKVYPSTDNMIYATSEYIRPYEAVDNWKDLRPIKVLWCDSNFMDMSVPDDQRFIENGFNAVSVDIPMLALMYKGFYQGQTDELILGPDQFIATWVLPRIIESQVDMSCISATMAIFDGDYRSQTRVNTNIYLPSYSGEFHKIAMHALNRIEGSRMSYVHMLQSLPSVYKDSGLEALVLPSFAPTTQVEWAMLATRLKVIEFLLKVGGKSGRTANNGWIQQLKPYCRDIQSARIPYTEMSDNMANYIENTLSYIRKL